MRVLLNLMINFDDSKLLSAKSVQELHCPFLQLFPGVNSLRVSSGPLKTVKQTPREVSTYIAPIDMYRCKYFIDVETVIFDPWLVVDWSLLHRFH